MYSRNNILHILTDILSVLVMVLVSDFFQHVLTYIIILLSKLCYLYLLLDSA